VGEQDRMFLPLDHLKVTGTQLDAIITELEAASARQNDVEDAVGRPAGDSDLRTPGSWHPAPTKEATA